MIGNSLTVLAERGGLRAADVRADRVGDARDREPEQRRLRPVDANRQLRPAFLAAELRVGDAGHIPHRGEHVLGNALRLFEIVAAHFDGEARCLAAAATATPLSRRVICWLPPEHACRDLHAGEPDEHTTKVGGDLVTRPLAFRGGREHAP